MKPECKLLGENGNVFNLIGIVRKTLRNEGLDAELESFNTELSKLTENGGTYNDVLTLFRDYVDIV